MNKAELITAVAQKSGLTRKDADKVVASVLESITETLASGEKVSLVGFGTFEVKERAAHQGINPSTKEPMQIPASKSPVFKSGKQLKDAVKQESCALSHRAPQIPKKEFAARFFVRRN